MFLGTPKHKGDIVDRIETIPQRLSIGEEVTVSPYCGLVADWLRTGCGLVASEDWL